MRLSNVNPTIVSCSSQNCNWWHARVVWNFNGVQHATGWLDIDIDQDTVGIDGLGLHGIVGMEEVKCRGGWTSINIWLSLFGLCSRRCGSQCRSGRRQRACCLWFLWFVRLVCICAAVHLVCVCAFRLWLLLVCAGLWLLLCWFRKRWN